MLRGLDVSSYQGQIDWAAVASVLHCRFAIVKISEGNFKQPDSFAARNLAGARQAGLLVGGYFLPHLDGDVELQAETHWKLSCDLGAWQEGDLPMSCDLEEPDPSHWTKLGLGPAEVRSRCLAYAYALFELSGGVTRPMIYTYPDFWKDMGGAGEPRFSSYPLWQASYGLKSWPIPGENPRVLQPWTSYTFWQFSDEMTLPHGAKFDADAFWGAETDLQALRRPVPLGVMVADPAIQGSDTKTPTRST